MSAVNHQFRLAARPVGLPKRSDWTLTEEPAPEPGAEEFLVKILYISLDPAMRGWMNEGRSYVAPVGIGELMRAAAVGKVIGSKHPGFAVGDHVYGRFGVQEYAVSKGDGVTKVDPSQAPLPVFLGTLGLPGMTAYFGLLDIGKPQAGQTVVVSGAAGAVGMVAGQIARIHGCRVVGIAGGPEKCRYLVAEIGFDAAIDYKTEDVRKALSQQCPKGIDVYFDNVGGDILDAALANLGAPRPHRNMRRDLAVQQHDAGQGAEQLSFPAGQPRQYDRHGRLRLRRPLSRGDKRHCRLARRRQAQVARGYRRRVCNLS